MTRRSATPIAALYRWAPVLAFVLIVVGLNISLTLVALMAGLWNAEHTLMQRYGVMRIYGRKVGDDQGAIEKPMLIIWLVAGIAYIGGYVDLQRLVIKLGFAGTNARSVGLLGDLTSLARVVFWVAALVGVVFVVRWWQGERRLGVVRQPTKARICARHRSSDRRGDDRSDRRRCGIRGRPRHRVLRRRAQFVAQTQRRRAGGDGHSNARSPNRGVRRSTSPRSACWSS